MTEPLKIEQVDAHKPWIKALVYGDPGVGKTTFAATAQKHDAMSDVLFINIEGGMLSVRGTGVAATEKIKHTNQIEELFWKLKSDSDFARYQTVVIDSGTELQTLNLSNIVEDSIAKKRTKGRSVDDIHLEDYGKSTAQLRRLFRNFRDLDKHVVVTALPKRVMPQNAGAQSTGEPTLVYPAFTEKLAFSVMGYMDFVWYLYTDKEGHRKLLTQEQGVYKAKTRGQVFAQEIGKSVSDPDLSVLFQTLLNTERSK